MKLSFIFECFCQLINISLVVDKKEVYSLKKIIFVTEVTAVGNDNMSDYTAPSMRRSHFLYFEGM